MRIALCPVFSEPPSENLLVVETQARQPGEPPATRMLELEPTSGDGSVRARDLELTDRLASLGAMVAGVAHEINNPLTVVLANAELVSDDMKRARASLCDSAPQGEPLIQMLDDAISAQRDLQIAATCIARIVADLRVFSQPRPAGEPAADVKRAVEWAVRSTAHERRMRARIETDLTPTPPARVDETKLGQVLINLLTNAAQAIPLGDAEHQRIKVAARLVRDEVILEVSDTGPGMPPEVVSRIFDPFFTTKESGVGTGLGLSICAAIVQEAGGQIAVESVVGRGTTFRIAVPAAPSPRSR